MYISLGIAWERLAKEINFSILVFSYTTYTSTQCIQNLNIMALIAGEKSVMDFYSDLKKYTPQPLYNTIVGVHSINHVS